MRYCEYLYLKNHSSFIRNSNLAGNLIVLFVKSGQPNVVYLRKTVYAFKGIIYLKQIYQSFFSSSD